MRMTSWGKWAPLKLTAIVALPHVAWWVTGGEHTLKRLKGKFATKPSHLQLRVICLTFWDLRPTPGDCWIAACHKREWCKALADTSVGNTGRRRFTAKTV